MLHLPQSIVKPIDMSLVAIAEADYVTVPLEAEDEVESLTPDQRQRYIAELEERMREAARKFEFELAAKIRDRVKSLRGVLSPVDVIAEAGTANPEE